MFVFKCKSTLKYLRGSRDSSKSQKTEEISRIQIEIHKTSHPVTQTHNRSVRMFILILGPTLLKLLLPCSSYPPHFATVASSLRKKEVDKTCQLHSGWMLGFVHFVCFPLKKKKGDNTKRHQTLPRWTHKSRNRLQFLGITAWQLLLKKLAVVPSPCAFSAFSLKIWLWFFSEEPIPIPHLPPPGKKLRPSLKILPQLWL